MRARLLVLAAILLIAGLQLSRESGRAVAPPSGETGNPASERPTPGLAPTSPSATFARDPFRFSEDEPVARASRAALPSTPVAPPPSPEPPPARVRLVGLVRSDGVLRAALAVDGEVVLASAGDTIFGFRVLSLDEERGVRVRDPEGLEATLSLPEGP
jgi:hypothetical protein